MSTYHAPLTDIRFALHDVLQVESLFSTLGFDDARELLDRATRLVEEHLP